MLTLNQKGAAHLLVPLLLLAAIAAGVYFIQKEGFFKLFSKAGPGVNIEFVDSQGLPVKTTTVPKITFKINFPSETYFTEETVSAPVTLEPAAVVLLSEDSKQTVNMRKYPFTGKYSVIERYTFSSSTIGKKTLYAQFIMKNGKRVNANPYPATIELVALPSPTPTFTPSNPPSTVLNKKVMLVMYNPTLSNGQKLYQSRGWNDSYKLTDQIISSLNTASGGMVNYQIVETQERNEFPKKIDGFRYTESTYNACRSNNATCHQPDAADYNQMWTDLNICSKVSSGQIDEIFVWGAGYFGFDEFAYKIPGNKMPYNQPTDYWLYSGRTKNIPDCNGKTVFVMGWIPEVGADNALESYGHRTESALALTLGRGFWNACNGNSDFDQFTCLNKDITQSTPVQVAGCGNSHYPPNALNDYEYGRTEIVSTTCNSFKNYPSVPITSQANCNAWSCSKMGFFNFWMDHFPRVSGVNSNGNLNNWWKYIVDFDKAVTEAKGTPFP